MIDDTFDLDGPGDSDAGSATARVADALALFGHSGSHDERDARPPAEPHVIDGALGQMFDALAVLCADTNLEPDLDDVMWATVNVFHRRGDVLGRMLDGNESAQRQSQRDQDGSEVRSVELERLVEQGRALIERRAGLETVRDAAAKLYRVHTGSAWRPRSGSHVGRRALTAAVIDSRDFIAAKRRAEIEPLLPPGPRIAFAGGVACTDHVRIWAILDKVRAKHAGMVLLHGGSPRGAERIAACWADNRAVPQIVFKPDWARHQKAAPFKRNDALLGTLPIGVIVFPGSGISENLADKANALGIPVWRCREGAA